MTENEVHETQRKPLPFTQEKIQETFLAPRIEANRTRGLEAVYTWQSGGDHFD